MCPGGLKSGGLRVGASELEVGACRCAPCPRRPPSRAGFRYARPPARRPEPAALIPGRPSVPPTSQSQRPTRDPSPAGARCVVDDDGGAALLGAPERRRPAARRDAGASEDGGAPVATQSPAEGLLARPSPLVPRAARRTRARLREAPQPLDVPHSWALLRPSLTNTTRGGREEIVCASFQI